MLERPHGDRRRPRPDRRHAPAQPRQFLQCGSGQGRHRRRSRLGPGHQGRRHRGARRPGRRRCACSLDPARHLPAVASPGFRVNVSTVELAGAQLSFARSPDGQVFLGNAATMHAARKASGAAPAAEPVSTDGGFPDIFRAMQIVDHGLEPSISAAVKAGFLHFSLVDSKIDVWDAEHAQQRTLPDTDLNLTVDPTTTQPRRHLRQLRIRRPLVGDLRARQGPRDRRADDVGRLLAADACRPLPQARRQGRLARRRRAALRARQRALRARRRGGRCHDAARCRRRRFHLRRYQGDGADRRGDAEAALGHPQQGRHRRAFRLLFRRDARRGHRLGQAGGRPGGAALRLQPRIDGRHPQAARLERAAARRRPHRRLRPRRRAGAAHHLRQRRHRHPAGLDHVPPARSSSRNRRRRS